MNFSDVILGFKILRDANLKEIESNLVLTGKDEGKLLEQVTNSLKKFKGRKNIVETDKNAVATESVLMSEEMESALIAKGWKPPKKPRKRSRSVSPNAKDNSGGGGFKGRKNPLDSNFKVMKCFLCACDHEDKCSCPCVYHLANKCPKKKKAKPQEQGKKQPELGLFVETNVKENTDAVCVTMAEERSILEEEDELVLVVRENLEELLSNITTDDFEAVIDCACPTTVTGIGWINRFYDALDEESKKQVVKMKRKKMYKFGGGEKLQSMNR